MSFWDELHASRFAYRQYVDSLRSERFGFISVQSALHKLRGWKTEFEELEARVRASDTKAKSTVQEEIRKVDQKIDWYLEQLNRLKEKERKLNDNISRLQDSIQRLKDSISRDYSQQGVAMSRKGNAWKGISTRIQEKERKVREMENSLGEMRSALAVLHS